MGQSWSSRLLSMFGRVSDHKHPSEILPLEVLKIDWKIVAIN